MFKLSRTIKELRIHLCPNSSNSKGLREFISQNYINLKSGNPELPILIRECSNIEPKLWIRYEFGKESNKSLKDLNSNQISSILKNLNG